MEILKFSNKCVYRDVDGHLYRLNKKSKKANKPNYFVCYIKNCEARLKVAGESKQMTAEHSHSNKLAKREFTRIKFDVKLNEHLFSTDISAFSNEQVYEQVLMQIRVAKFDGAQAKENSNHKNASVQHEKV